MSPFKNIATSMYLVLIKTLQAIGQPSGLKMNIFLPPSLLGPTCLFLLLLPQLLVFYPKNHLQDQCQEAFPVCLLLGVLQSHVLHLNLLSE